MKIICGNITCPQKGIPQDENKFYKQADKKNGRQSECKICSSERNKKRYHNQKDWTKLYLG